MSVGILPLLNEDQVSINLFQLRGEVFFFFNVKTYPSIEGSREHKVELNNNQ